MGLKIHIGLIAVSLAWGISFASAQSKSIVIYGRVTDKNHNGIGYAAIQNMSTGEGINADARGFYILKTTLPADLNIFALGYLIHQKQLSQSHKDSIAIDFILEENTAELHAITITASHPPELVDEAPNLMDFELKDNRLWLIYSVKGGDKIVVTDTGGNSITQMTLRYHLHKDSINLTPHGFLYGVYKDSIQLYSMDNNVLNNNEIKVIRMSLDTYMEHAGTLVGFRPPYYYYISYDSTGNSRVNYSCFDKADNATKIIYRYTDSKLQRANRETEETMLILQSLLPLENAYNGQAGTDNRNDTLINVLGYQPDEMTMNALLRSIVIPQGASTEEIENAYANAQSLVSSSADPYAASNESNALSMMKGKVFSLLRIVNDSVYIFNFDNNIITVYSPANTYIRQLSFGVSINAIRYRKKDILVDEQTQECYFKYVRWYHTYLEKIDLGTGKALNTIELNHPFVDKVRVSGGYAYFSYFNTQDKTNIYNGQTCLYKQRLD